jgi:sugar lactone lactonase YvrE
MDGGIAVRRSGEWKRELESERSQISWLAEDAGGNLWAASCGNGVWMFDGKAWKAFLQDQGPINLLKVTSDKRVWVSTQKSGGLRYWDGAEWKVSLEGPLPVICLVELPNVALVAGGVLDGLHILGNYSVKGE